MGFPVSGSSTRSSSAKRVLLAVACGCAVAITSAQQPFRSGARTVAVYTTVTDRQGRLVPDLTRDDFEIYDNGRRQPISLFANDVQPITVVMLLDRSGSMRANFRFVEVAATEFVKALLPGDKARIGSFAGRIQLDPRDFTSDREELRAILSTELQAEGPTPLWNAVGVGVTALLRQDGRRVILVFTDGVNDTMGGRTIGIDDALRRAQEEDVMVYAIGLTSEIRVARRGGSGPRVPTLPGRSGGGTRVYLIRPDRGLARIAAETGGGYFELKRAADLSATFARVADELHRQYAIGFEPTALDGRSHSLEVRVKRPDLVARARRSYIASPDK